MEMKLEMSSRGLEILSKRKSGANQNGLPSALSSHSILSLTFSYELYCSNLIVYSPHVSLAPSLPFLLLWYDTDSAAALYCSNRPPEAIILRQPPFERGRDTEEGNAKKWSLCLSGFMTLALASHTLTLFCMNHIGFYQTFPSD